MTPDQLKASILQLAIQGKLVPQRPDEGTAEELYQQIQREKKKLTAAGKLKKEKPLPPITEDEIPFDIPESWKWVRLGEIFEIVTGKTPSKSDIQNYTPDEVPFYKPADIGQASHIEAATQRVSKKGSRSAPLLPKGAILVNCIGNIGKCAIIDKEGICNQQINAVIPISAIALEYFLCVLRSDYAINTEKHSASATTLPILNKLKFSKICIPLPPLGEQQRIVEKIVQMLPLVEQYGEAYTALESLDARFPGDMRKSILKYAIQGKLVPQRPEEGTAEELYQQIQREKKKLTAAGKLKKEKPLPPITEDEIPFDIPDSWKWVRIGEIFTLQAGKFISADNISEIESEGLFPCYGGNGCRGYVDRYNREGDFPLIGRQGALCGNIKRAKGKFYATEHAVVVDTYAKTNVDWACAALTALNLNKYATATAQPGLAVSKIMEAMIPLPPLIEQKRIIHKIEDLYT